MSGIDLIVKEWFEIAADELRVAANSFDTMYPKPLEIICYHCQQSVEKVLKGFLTDKGIEPPYIHDLEQLRLMCVEYDSSFESIQEACQKLNIYSASTRYPKRPEILEPDTAFALKEAGRIYEFCADLLPAYKVSLSIHKRDR